MAIRDDRETGNMRDLSIDLQNLADCLGHLGQPGPARDAAATALTSAQAANDREEIRNSHAYLGRAAGLADDAAEAERHFTAADQIEVADSPVGNHMYSLRGVQWAEWLARTGREGPARALTERNAEISRGNHWNEDVARCDWMLGRLARAAGEITAAGEHLAAAAGSIGLDYLPELAITLADLAEHARTSNDLDAAPARHRGDHHRRPPAGRLPRPPPWQSGPASAPARPTAAADPALVPGPRRRRRRAAAGYPAPAGLARTGRTARPRRPRPRRGYRPGMGRQSRGPACPAGPTGPGPGSAGHRGTAGRCPGSGRRRPGGR